MYIHVHTCTHILRHTYITDINSLSHNYSLKNTHCTCLSSWNFVFPPLLHQSWKSSLDVTWKVGHVEACPGKMPQTSSGGWLNFRGPTPCSLVQTGTNTEPLDTTRRCSPRFLPYMERPGLDADPGYKTSPHPSYLADSLCLLAYPSPGVLPKSDRPIKSFINGP